MKQEKNRKQKEMLEENVQSEVFGDEHSKEMEQNESIELKAHFDALNDKYLRLVAMYLFHLTKYNQQLSIRIPSRPSQFSSYGFCFSVKFDRQQRR